MRAYMIFENLKLIPDRKNRESYEKNKIIFVLEKLNTKWAWSRFGPKIFSLILIIAVIQKKHFKMATNICASFVEL